MKRFRVPVLLAVTLVVVVLLAVGRPGRQGAAGFATPGDCVQAYAEACQDGDVSAYLRCLAGPLREARGQAADPGKLAEALRLSMAEVKGWVQSAPVVEGEAARVDVDVVRPGGTRRVRFRLTRAPGGWLISAVDAPRDVPTPVRYGTPVSAGPEGPAPPDEPGD